MNTIEHSYSQIEYYLKRDNVFVVDGRHMYLPMVVMGVKEDKEGVLRLKVNGARHCWIKVTSYHDIYTDGETSIFEVGSSMGETPNLRSDSVSGGVLEYYREAMSERLRREVEQEVLRLQRDCVTRLPYFADEA